MSHRICCYTLFNITQTGVMNRSRPNENDVAEWLSKRNTQCNFDTILQVISLRSQPEVVKKPTKIQITIEDSHRFGFLYQYDETSYCWKFEFEIQHSSVFENGIQPLGALYRDCMRVPMIICTEQISDIPAFLDVSEELRTIYFELL